MSGHRPHYLSTAPSSSLSLNSKGPQISHKPLNVKRPNRAEVGFWPPQSAVDLFLRRWRVGHGIFRELEASGRVVAAIPQ